MPHTSSKEGFAAPYATFGWNSDGTLNVYAGLRRQAIRDAALGLPHAAIADDWWEAGVLTVKGKQWQPRAVKQLILTPCNAGFEAYGNEVVTGNDGTPIKGDWVPLIDEITWREACAAILDASNDGILRSKSLLSPLAQCGKCGARMARQKRNDIIYGYVCRSKRRGGCAGVYINGNHLDAQILDLAKAILKKRPTGVNATTRRHARRVAKIESAWLDASLDRQKTVLRQLFAAVVIQPSSRLGGYDPNRVEVIWRED